MKNFLFIIFSYILVIPAVFAQTTGDNFRLSESSKRGNAQYGLTAVEVLSTFRGSGLIVLLNEEPVVVTNSHNLVGKKEAKFRMPERTLEFFISGPLKIQKQKFSIPWTFSDVLYDFPLEDITILKPRISIGSFEYQVIKELGRLNGNLCTQCKKPWVANLKDIFFYDTLSVSSRGNTTVIPKIQQTPAKLISDSVISDGSYPVIRIPMYGYPGISGGAFYHKGILAGLATKISLSGTPEIYATPFFVIGNLINGKVKAQDSYWLDGALVVNTSGQQIAVKSATNGGGEIGNGGGEIGNGGGEIGNGGGEIGNGGGEIKSQTSSFWNMNIPAGNEKIQYQTWNPFKAKSSQFLLNSQRIAFFEINQVFKAPTIALFLKTKKQGQHLQTWNYDESSFEYLKRVRQQRTNQSLNLARILIHNPLRRELTPLLEISPTAFWDGRQVLLPDANDNWTPEYKSPEPAPKSVMEYPRFKTKQGTYYSFPFESHRNDLLIDTGFDSKSLGSESPALSPNLDKIQIKISKDMQRFQVIETLIGTKTIQINDLESKRSHSIATDIYESKDNRYQAAVIYSSTDLTQIERIYVQSKNILIEFWSCEKEALCLY